MFQGPHRPRCCVPMLVDMVNGGAVFVRKDYVGFRRTNCSGVFGVIWIERRSQLAGANGDAAQQNVAEWETKLIEVVIWFIVKEDVESSPQVMGDAPS